MLDIPGGFADVRKTVGGTGAVQGMSEYPEAVFGRFVARTHRLEQRADLIDFTVQRAYLMSLQFIKHCLLLRYAEEKLV